MKLFRPYGKCGSDTSLFKLMKMGLVFGKVTRTGCSPSMPRSEAHALILVFSMKRLAHVILYAAICSFRVLVSLGCAYKDPQPFPSFGREAVPSLIHGFFGNCGGIKTVFTLTRP